MTKADSPLLLRLPSELLHQILGHLSLYDLLTIGLANHTLHEHAQHDTLWQPLVEAQVPTSNLPKPANSTWRAVYQLHHPYWFIVKRKIWFSDVPNTGKLLVARYDHRINAIEAYTLVAQRRQPTMQTWEWNPEAIIHTFHPRVQLDLNAPVIRLGTEAYNGATGNIGHRLQKEIPMDVIHDDGRQTAAGIHSRLLLTRPWPMTITSEATPVWPPLTLPNTERTRNDPPPSGFRQPAQKPATLDQLSTSTFRIRKWMEFSSTFGYGVSMRIGEEISTWSTLPEDSYTPTKQKPWQGIWCGDYAGHGCKFLVIMQPDNPRPLPERAEWAIRVREREGSVSSAGGSWSTAPMDVASSDDHDGMETADDVEASVATLQEAFHERESRSPRPGENESVYRGRLEAVKLTGDPNIPRGEYTFIAPDIIGPNGLLRVASEDMFKGARIVKSVGHIAEPGFRDDSYMTSQLIMISHDRLAQYWETFGHVSFYERVDVDAFTRV